MENQQQNEEFKKQAEIEKEERIRAEARAKAEEEIKTNKKKEEQKKTGKWRLVVGLGIIVFIAFFIAILGSLGGGKGEKTQPSERNTTITIAFAEEVIKGILKAPSTANFVDVEAYELSNEKDVWAVNGYVDSQNSFGAMIRSQWEVQLDFRDGKGGTVKSILFDGKKMQ